ncbi:DUF1707 domain-containing protein [Actinoplanes sp. N902-109]|uniref:DUF1707 SHOCT-like domain-containing protein n=1 Tax=Actinoplanes sp. (strain N902-109) TaxID=649831 RepID=UPI00032954E3|nr:DUF1707 domain-containing protein [Actinoplanes sp. N902-109]AGL14403.1 hypothetical protein L083_0893 [Actinoplanes sp. N902-109]
MAKEVARKPEADALRAADADRHRIAERLKSALDEGRLSLAEYDDRVRLAYAARTYGDLTGLVEDLPEPGLSAEEIARRTADRERRAARRLPTALTVLWTIYAAVLVVNLVVWVLVEATVDADVYPWPIWLLVPGAALAATTVGVQHIRNRRRSGR